MSREIWLSNVAGKVPTVAQLELAASNIAYNRADGKFYGLLVVGSSKQVIQLNGLTGITLGSIAEKDFWSGTQTAYDAITTKDSNTIYFIEEE